MDEGSHCKETFEVVSRIDENNNKIINEYQFIETLGFGSFSKVKLAKNLNNNTEYVFLL